MKTMKKYKLLKSEDNTFNNPKNRWMIYIVTLIVECTLINHGYHLGAMSGVILLIKDDSDFQLNIQWIQLLMAGPLFFGALFGPIGSIISDRFGRKKALLSANIFYILGSVMCGLAYNKEIFLVGRILFGSGSGIAKSVNMLYVAECSPTKIRGCLLALSQPLLVFGILLGTLVSALFSQEKNAMSYIWGLQAIFAFILFLALICIPESPRWLMQKSCKDEARKSMMKIRNGENIEQELQQIELDMKEKNNPEQGCLLMKMLKNRHTRRALFVSTGVRLFCNFSSGNILINYSGIIIEMCGLVNVSNALWQSVIINSSSFLFAFVGVYLIDKVGRRKIAITGLLGLFFCSLCLGTTLLMAAKYSPVINSTDNLTNITCSQYRQCNDCVTDKNCGFCFDDISGPINGACLPVSSTSNMLSELGACNSTKTLSKYHTKWAYHYCPTSFWWVAIIELGLILMFQAVAVNLLPRTLNAELYPLWARSTGNGIAVVTSSIANLIIMSFFLSLVELINSYGVFYLMSSVSLFGSLFCFFFIPETKNKMLEEIKI